MRGSPVTRPVSGEPFHLQGELDDRLARMAQLEADLAGRGSGSSEPQPIAE